MLDKVIKFFIMMTLMIAGGALSQLASPYITQYLSTEFFQTDLGFFKLTVAGATCIFIGALLGGVIGWFLSPYLINKLGTFTAFVEKQLNKMPIHDVIAGAVGLAIGLIIADLLGNAFSRIPVVGDYIPIVFSIVLGTLGIRITIKKRKEIESSFSSVPKTLREMLRNRDKHLKGIETDTPENLDSDTTITEIDAEEVAEHKVNLVKENFAHNPNYKILDTNVIIDGRISDICKTGFLEGKLLIPVFVLEELQHIADSADSLRRVRGRRGLDVLQKIQDESPLEVEVMNIDFDDIHEVDSKLVRLAQKIGGKIITNDFNLNKVAQLRGVEVLNINDLSNAVKAVVIPGETMKVQVVRDGKEPGQGVAYLDDGTMIVIENGHRYLSRTISVEVTSALQTSAGRMIFAKPR